MLKVSIRLLSTNVLNAILIVLLVKEFLKTVQAASQDTLLKEFAFQHAPQTTLLLTVCVNLVTKNVMVASILVIIALIVPEDTINSVANVSKPVILTCSLITPPTCVLLAIPSARPAAA